MSLGTRIPVTLMPVLDALQRMGVEHYVCGSVASSIHGEPRTTIDIDVVADLSPTEARRLAEQITSNYYADADAMAQAVTNRRSFNVVHLTTGIKVDIFPVKDRDYDYRSLERRVTRPLGDEPDAPQVPVSSPEDTILAKLEWYRLGDEISDRQWRDLVNVLSLRNAELDQHYLDRWANRLGVHDLLDRARREAAT